MTDPTGAVDLGGVLRGLRRHADLSQRELAARAGVPQATLARLESGRAGDPKFRTVERLVRAAGGRFVIGLPPEAGREPSMPGVPGVPAVPAVPAVPHDDLRDEAGRRYPAHLDVWKVEHPRDWPGAWWAHWYNLPPEQWPLAVPSHTFERNRQHRDRRRVAEWVRRETRVRRVTVDLPEESWRFVAELPDGSLVGELRAHQRSPHLRWEYGDEEEREMVLDGILVAVEHRRLGIGRRLVAALVEEMRRAGIASAHAVADVPGIDLLLACGFEIGASRPADLRLALSLNEVEQPERHRRLPGLGPPAGRRPE